MQGIFRQRTHALRQIKASLTTTLSVNTFVREGRGVFVDQSECRIQWWWDMGS